MQRAPALVIAAVILFERYEQKDKSGKNDRRERPNNKTVITYVKSTHQQNIFRCLTQTKLGTLINIARKLLCRQTDLHYEQLRPLQA